VARYPLVDWSVHVPREAIPTEVARVALAAAEGGPFENFGTAFLAQLLGASYVPAGGTADGGSDGFESVFEDGSRPGVFVQMSVTNDFKAKIRHTVNRLAEAGRDPKSLTYLTSLVVANPDLHETDLTDELDVSIRIRDGAYVAAHVNDNVVTQQAFREHLAHFATYLSRPGASNLIPASKHVKSPAVYVFLAQEFERRGGDESLVDSMTDALILWALEDTDPDKGILMSAEEVLNAVAGTLPSVVSIIGPRLQARLEVLSKKPHRLVRAYERERMYCLPYQTRNLILEENAADVVLRDGVVLGLEDRARELGVDEDLVIEAAAVAMRSLQHAFECQGLEFSRFLQEQAPGDAPEMADSIRVALGQMEISGTRALEVGDLAFEVIKRVFYDSSEDERDYLQKLSRTYSLLFILNTEPRLLEYFQEMASDFYLYVGTDQLLRALSEHLLHKPDQMSRNTLDMAKSLGATLVLTEPVLDEVISHLRGSDFEYRNYMVGLDRHMTYEVARNASHIMLRAYLYALLPGAPTTVASWEAFVQHFCSYSMLDRGDGEEELKRYLLNLFGMVYVSREDLEELVDKEAVDVLASELEPQKQHHQLADNDALLAHAVYGRRKSENEMESQNVFGYLSWWLTGESSILRHTQKLIKANHGARYMMRPDFLLSFIALAPQANEARRAFSAVFPTLLGIKLARRTDPAKVHQLIEKAREAGDLDESRIGAAISTFADKLKSDFSHRYFGNVSQAATNSIDVAAVRDDF
jgi:hypothetical protein